jgi:PPM family protein phosphatase
VAVRLGRSSVVTDTGRRRRRNEDSYVCEPPLFAVADGMGGAQAGEVASRLAAAVLEEADGDELREERIVELIQEANRRVYQRSSEDPTASGMGTTMTVAVTGADSTVSIGHVGDSRAYRIRAGALEQLTRDHSLVGELMRSGKLSPEEAESHPQRSVITRAVGTEPDVDVDTFTVDAVPGDLFLLCSDGLTDMVSDDTIQAVVAAAQGDLETVARELVEAANASGGEDNITVLVFEIVDAGSSEMEDTVRLAPAGVTEPDDAEDTLDEFDAVPAVDTAVVPAAAIEEHLRQEEVRREEAEQRAQARPQRRVLPLLLLVLLLASIVVLVVWGLYR